MTKEQRSKLQSLISDISGLKGRDPQESKFKEWKEKVEKQLEESFGKTAEPYSRFQRISFFDFNRPGKPKDVPLSESERRVFLQKLDEARNVLYRFI